MRTSARIDAITATVKTAFTIADAKAALATPSITLATSPATKIKRALELDEAQKAAPGAVSDIRLGLRQAFKQAKADLASIELEALRAVQLADFIEAKADTIPASTPDVHAAAALALRGTPEAALVAKRLRFAARNCEEELKRLGRNWLLKTEAAVTTVSAKAGLQIFRAAHMDRHVKTYETLVLRAQAQSEGARKRSLEKLNARLGA